MNAERFDPAKDRSNREKHGLSLAFGDEVFADPHHLVIPSIRPIDGESRFKAVGMVEDKLYTAIHVWRDGVPRFISVRRSNASEEKRYRNPGGPQ